MNGHEHSLSVSTVNNTGRYSTIQIQHDIEEYYSGM